MKALPPGKLARRALAIMEAWPALPGVPAAGHVTTRGYWHPGAVAGCTKCQPPPQRPPGRPATR